MGIEAWSTTAGNNNSAAPNGAPEGMPFSGVNDVIRQIMADVRSWYQGGSWTNLGHTHTYSSSTATTVAGDVTAHYVAGRRVRAVGSSTGTIYGVIASSSYSAPNTTVNFTWDSGSLSNETLTISVGFQNITGYPTPVAGLKTSANVQSILSAADYAAIRTLLSLVVGTNVQAYDADTLKADTADTLTAGFAATPYNLGTISTGTATPNEANGNQQYGVNGGAFTLAPPTNKTTIVVELTNNGSAGAITTSGFTKVRGSFTTTNGHKFACFIQKTQTYSLLDIVALQ